MISHLIFLGLKFSQVKNKYSCKVTRRWKLLCMCMRSIDNFITIVVSRDSYKQKHIFQFAFFFFMFDIYTWKESLKTRSPKEVSSERTINEGQREISQIQKNIYLGLYLYKVWKQTKLICCCTYSTFVQTARSHHFLQADEGHMA